jgi:hypothetical protein
MPDPATPVITDLFQVEQALETVARPKPPYTPGNTNPADAQPALLTATGLLTILYGLGGLGNQLKTAGTDTAKALGDAATALRKVAEQLQTIASGGSDVKKTLESLQNALAVAQTVLPGSSPQLASGSQFFGQVMAVLTAVNNDTAKGAEVLFKFAQQLAAIAAAITPH